VVPRLNSRQLSELASAGGGRYVKMSADNRDLNVVAAAQQQLSIVSDSSEREDNLDYWIEYAPFAVLGLALMSLLFFRRGVMW